MTDESLREVGRLLEKYKRIIAVVGHYGSGKTNLAVNLAVDLIYALVDPRIKYD